MDQLLSPPPTDLSEAVDTPPQRPRRPKNMLAVSDDDQTPEPTLPLPSGFDEAKPPTCRQRQPKRNNRKVVISEDDRTPEPTLPLQEVIATPSNVRRGAPNHGRGQPRRTPEVLLTRRKPRQLETPGPSDSATPATTEAGTPDNNSCSSSSQVHSHSARSVSFSLAHAMYTQQKYYLGYSSQ